MATIIEQQINALLVQINDQIKQNNNNDITGPILNSILIKIVNLLNQKVGQLEDAGIPDIQTIVEGLFYLNQKITDLSNGNGGPQGGVIQLRNVTGSLTGVQVNDKVYFPGEKVIKTYTSQGWSNSTTPQEDVLYIDDSQTSNNLWRWDGTNLLSVIDLSVIKSDNKPVYKVFSNNGFPSNEIVIDAINNATSFTVQTDQFLLLKFVDNSNYNKPTSYVYSLKGIGAGSYGLNNTQLSATQVELLSITLTSAQDLTQLTSSQFIDIGDIGSQTIEDGFNDTFLPNTIQDPANGYIIVTAIQSGQQQYYLFVGTPGNYGNGGTEVAVNSDFIPFTDGSYGITEGKIPNHQWNGTELRWQNSDGTWGVYTDLQGPQGIGGQNGEVVYEWDGTSVRFQNADGTWGQYVNLQGPQGQDGAVINATVLYFHYLSETAPSTPLSGQRWYLPSTTSFLEYNGTTWQNAGQPAEDGLYIYIPTQELYLWKINTDPMSTVDGELLPIPSIIYIYIDGNPFLHVKGFGNIGPKGVVEVGDVANGGIFTYQSTNFFGSLKCIDDTGDVTTGVGVKWEPLSPSQI